MCIVHDIKTTQTTSISTLPRLGLASNLVCLASASSSLPLPYWLRTLLPCLASASTSLPWPLPRQNCLEPIPVERWYFQWPIENYTIRFGTHDFLLTFHSNHRPITHHFRDKRRFRSKIANFFTPMYFTPQLKGLPWNWASAQGSEKLEWRGYQKFEKFWSYV